MKITEAIQEIRKQIPVGISTAKKLLERANNHSETAIVNWKLQQEILFAQKVDVSQTTGKRILESVNYDFHKAILVYKDQYLTDIERIIQSSKKEEEVLSNFWVYIQTLLPKELTNYGWISEQGYQSLPSRVGELLRIWEWFAYNDWEGVTVEQDSTPKVIDLLKNQFNSPLYAQSIEEHLKQVNQLKEEYQINQSAIQGEKMDRYNAMVNTELYQSGEEQVDKMEKPIMKLLYEVLYREAKQIDRSLKKTFKSI